MSEDERRAVQLVQGKFPSMPVSDIRSLLKEHHGSAKAAIQELERKAEEAVAAESKQGKNFFAGGSGGSGQAVQARPDPAPTVDRLFEKAKADAETQGDSSTDAGAARTFFGAGRRLGHTENASPFVASTVREERDATLVVYRNGLRIDDGDLIPTGSAEYTEALTEMEQGYVPTILRKKYPNADVNLKLCDASEEDYVQQAYTAFQGSGRKLESVAATTGDASAIPQFDRAATFAFIPEEESSIVRLITTSGESKELQVNPKRHTVRDLYVAAHGMQPDLVAFVLVVRDRPPRKLLAASQDHTIEQEKLKRAVVAIQAP